MPAPDLARGLMLLAIAFAHAPLFVTDVGRGLPALNAVTDVIHNLFVSNHARPMFAFLFGYSLVQLMNRRTERGAAWVDVRRLLRRRGWWLVAIGLAHVVALVPIDILAAYGISAVLLAGLLRARDATLLWTAGAGLVPATAMVALAMWFPLSKGWSTLDAGSVAAGPRGAAELLVERLQGWPYTVAAGVIMVVPGVLAGMWAARRRVLDEPVRHRRFLAAFAVVAMTVSTVGAVPVSLVRLGWWEASAAALWGAAVAQPLTGYVGGIGMAAVAGLLAPVLTRRPNVVVTAVVTAVRALGQRSMSLYLFQSVVFVAVFFPYGLGLQDDLGLAGATGVAAATWLVSLLIADVMRRAGHRGPAEVLLRRLACRGT